MTRVQAREFDQFLLKFDTLTVKMGSYRKQVEKVLERMNNGKKIERNPPRDSQ